MYVSWLVFDETFGRGRETAEMIADRAGVTLEELAAASFVRSGDGPLRKLLPDVPPEDMEDCLSRWLGEIYGGPARERYEWAAAREGIPLEQLLSRDLTLALLDAFGAFRPRDAGAP